MKQLSKTKSIVYHLYPGLLITSGFILLAAALNKLHYPPQFSLLIAVLLVAVPLLIFHLWRVKKSEGLRNISQVNGLTSRLSIGKLILYAVGLTVIAFLLWG